MNTCKWGFMSLAILLAACGSSKVFETASAPGGDTAFPVTRTDAEAIVSKFGRRLD